MDIKTLNKDLKKRNCAFLSGNGFSMNFDNDFSNIHERLYSAHKQLYKITNYKVEGNQALKKKLLDNYKAVRNKLKYIDESDFYKIFDDGVRFATSILEADGVTKELKESGYIHELVFGISELNGLQLISEKGIENGSSFVNIEYWPLLIYFYFALEKLDSPNYNFPEDNMFVDLIKVGYSSKVQINVGESLQQFVLFNGFNTYYKILYSLAIYSGGKAVDIDKFNKTDRLDMLKLSGFLNKFKTLVTLNYDHILENVTQKEVVHLHGQFVKNIEEYVYNQCISIIDEIEGIICCSNILIGDFFINKSFFSVMCKLHSKKNLISADLIDHLIIEKRIDEVLIFGVNINNDQDIIRSIMIAFHKANIKKPKILYSYFNTKERESFDQQFKDVITFSKELSRYAGKIKVEFIKTQDILNEFFWHK